MRKITTNHGTFVICTITVIILVVLLFVTVRRRWLSEPFEANPFASALLGPLPVSTVLLKKATCVQKFPMASYMGESICFDVGDHSDMKSLTNINTPGSMKIPNGIMLQAYGEFSGQVFTAIGPEAIEIWKPEWLVTRFIVHPSTLTAKIPLRSAPGEAAANIIAIDPLPSEDDWKEMIGGYIKTFPTKADLSDQPSLSPDWIYAAV